MKNPHESGGRSGNHHLILFVVTIFSSYKKCFVYNITRYVALMVSNQADYPDFSNGLVGIYTALDGAPAR